MKVLLTETKTAHPNGEEGVGVGGLHNYLSADKCWSDIEMR